MPSGRFGIKSIPPGESPLRALAQKSWDMGPGWFGFILDEETQVFDDNII